MTDDKELIARLRDADLYNAQHYERDPLHKQAADRIETLIAERDEAWKRAAHSEKMWGEAEVKLAKAVEALEDIVKDCEADYPPSHGAIKHFAIATLAEISSEAALNKGESRDVPDR